MDEKLGRILIDLKLINAEQLEQVLVAQKQLEVTHGKKMKLGQLLLLSEVITLPQLQAALRHQVHKAQESRGHAIEARRKDRAEEMKSIVKTDEPKEDTFMGRLKSLFQKK